MATATRAGQPVRRIRDGVLGITTDAPLKRSPRVGVIWVGAPYSTYAQLDDIERVEIQEKS